MPDGIHLLHLCLDLGEVSILNVFSRGTRRLFKDACKAGKATYSCAHIPHSELAGPQTLRAIAPAARCVGMGGGPSHDENHTSLTSLTFSKGGPVSRFLETGSLAVGGAMMMV